MNLQDCEIISKEIGYGDLGVYGDMGYEIIPSVNGICYQNIISTHPKSIIKYKIPENYNFFSCKIALNDSSEEFSSANFKIYVDDELRFSSYNLGKFVISNVEIILDDNSTITLECDIQNKIITHCLWIDCLFSSKPEYILDSIRRTKIKTKYIKNKCENLIVSYLDENFIEYAQLLRQSIINNSKIDLNFVYLIEDKDCLRQFCISNNSNYIEIADIYDCEISTKKEKSIYHKAATYSVAKFINAENYIILDLDMICGSDISTLIERINATTDEILICRDAHTEGLSFGDLISSDWSAYNGTKKSKHILGLQIHECQSNTIINSGVIAGKKEAILNIEDQIRRLSPASLYYLNEIDNPVREQALFNLALIRYNKYQLLHKKYNLQALWEEIIIDYKNNKLSFFSEEFSPCMIHFNGPESKSILNKINSNIKNKQDFNINRIKSGRRIAELLSNDNIKILDIQNDDGIINSFIKTTQSKNYKIEKIINNQKQIINAFESLFTLPIEDLYIEIKNSKHKFDAVILSNLDTQTNTALKLSLLTNNLKEKGFVIFNQYNNENTIMNILDKKEDLYNLRVNEIIEESPIQKIYILSK